MEKLAIIIMNITVATFNVHFGKNTEKIINTIKENRNLRNVDIFLLQEIEAHTVEEKERAYKIAEGLGMNWIYAPSRFISRGTHGLAVLSKYPIVNHEVTQLEFFKLFRRARTRIALNVEIEIENQKILVSNVHLDTSLSFEERAIQISSIVSKLRDHDIKKIIIGGDLNTLPFRFIKRGLPYFYDNQAHKMYEFMKSYGFDSLMQRVDFTLKQGPIKWALDAIYTKGVSMVHFGVEKNVFVSDHKPVWAEIKID